MITTTAILTGKARADLFAKFASLERAGLPLEQALRIVQQESPRVFQAALKSLIRFVRQGRALAQAGQQSGVFLPWEARMIQVGTEAGKLERTFSRLADHYATRARRSRTLKARLAYPLGILVLAIFVAPLPAIILGVIGPGGYLLRTVLPLSALYALMRFTIDSYRRLGAAEQNHGLATLLLAVPGLRNLIRRQQQRDFLANLATLLEAGIPAVEASQLAARSVANPILRARFTAVSAAVEAGDSVAQALSEALEDTHGLALINAGEVAGRLDEMLQHYVRQLDERLDITLGLIAEWLPRVVYAVVAGLIISNIL